MLLLAPEHRLSLKLKRLELGAQAGKQEVCQLLDDLAQLPYMDIMDEVDELLHHRWDSNLQCKTHECCVQLRARH